jgi:hypothetical protein
MGYIYSWTGDRAAAAIAQVTWPLPVHNQRRNMKLPFKIMLSDPASKHALETVTNPYSGQSCQLPRYAVAVYDTIKGAEVTGDVDLMRKGLTWFQKNFTDQYYVLLD